jgi:hypothetical protein
MQEDNEQMDGRNGECEMCLGFANDENSKLRKKTLGQRHKSWLILNRLFIMGDQRFHYNVINTSNYVSINRVHGQGIIQTITL